MGREVPFLETTSPRASLWGVLEVQVEAAYGPSSHPYAWWALPLAAHQGGFAACPYPAPQLVLAWAGLLQFF